MSDPKISLNKLGEYLTATPSRRRRIVQDQQDPKAFITTRYSEAREAIVEFLASGMSDEDRLSSVAKKLRENTSGSDFARQDRVASAEAIDNFLEASDQIELEDLTVVPADDISAGSMHVAGVRVSVRPDAYLQDPITKDIIGAIKLHFPKTTPLNDISSKYVASTLKVFLIEERGSKLVNHKKCYIIDVSTQTATSAPKSHKKNMNDISAACEEIRARWQLGDG
ncbi:hypothetical protein NG831_00230 [Xanthomonas sacchari]|uniref:hypothetical protein n=1 Tax=Xanthomonas sacchari TaxID=56458 RepID=UPI00225448B2|nr:hypothetical protein [Xanthomonas sacchari]MCW0410682.1 hypothetical protein [Xanthomonas sacchari]UYK66700.1 hypothetical protein NG831_00230 [Xanthomonas sacchari]